MDFLSDCRHISDEIKIAIQPFVGSKDGGKIVGMGADNTPTAYLDKIAEDVALSYLRDIEADVIVLSEEAGVVELEPGAQDIIYLDPIDGTFNAIVDIPVYALSMAYASHGEITHGFVSNLATDEIFMARKGHGTTKNGSTVHISDVTNLHDASCTIYTHKQKKVEQLLQLSLSVRRVRHLGASSLELAYVAAGGLDAYVDTRGSLRITDAAAGMLLCTEAGGVLSDHNGMNPVFADSVRLGSSLIASNQHLYKEIVELTRHSGHEAYGL
jgi:myo-inositol-1(or 4)-monophosphatase